jgi:hypothetical protein
MLSEWFTLWAINGILHCDDEDSTCELGFAIHLLAPLVGGAMGAVYALAFGLTVRPRTRTTARVALLVPVAMTWLVAAVMLAGTGQS